MVGREEMTVVFWTRPTNQRDDTTGRWAESRRRRATKVHVSPDGSVTGCGASVPDEHVTVVAVTADWHEYTNCYNCAYRLWPEHAPPGYLRPRDSADFPPRPECPHHPGQGREPLLCPICTPAAARPGAECTPETGVEEPDRVWTSSATAGAGVLTGPQTVERAGPAPDDEITRGLHVLPRPGMSRAEFIQFANAISVAAWIADRQATVLHVGDQALTDDLNEAWNADGFPGARWHTC